MEASEFILNVIRSGYRSPFRYLPLPQEFKNNMSALKEKDFVESTILDFLKNDFILEVEKPFIVSPLSVSESSGKKSRFAFSYVRSAKDGRPDLGWMSGLLRWSLARIGEPMRWSERVETIGDFLDDLGWSQSDQEWDSTKQFGIECFVVADRPGDKSQRRKSIVPRPVESPHQETSGVF